MDLKKTILFWQPEVDFLRVFLVSPKRRRVLLLLNYSIWALLFYISFLLVSANPNIFWQILLATFLAELIERYIKTKVFWQRPLIAKKNPIPPGLVKKWYNTGSFPSGHMTKAVYFLLFMIQYQVFNPVIYLLLVVPLLVFRIMVGFHYPIDFLGGLVIGFLSWFLVSTLVFPQPLVELADTIFRTVFFLFL